MKRTRSRSTRERSDRRHTWRASQPRSTSCCLRERSRALTSRPTALIHDCSIRSRFFGRSRGKVLGMAANKTPATPEPGQDSTVEDWFGQSVERDKELAEDLSEQLPPREAERVFEQQAKGVPEQQARRGP